MSEAIWYFADGDEERGPVTESQIRSLIGTGNLKRDDLVWREGMDDWVPVSDVPDLSAAENAAPAPSGSSGGSKAKLEKIVVPAEPKEKRKNTRRSNARMRGGWSPTRPTEIFKYLTFLGQPLILLGLLMVLSSRGCESLATRYAERLAARSDVAEAKFQADWREKEAKLARELKSLEEMETLSPVDNQRLGTLQEDLKKLEDQRTAALEEQRDGLWHDLSAAAREARSSASMWNYWRGCLFWSGTAILILGLLTLGFTGDGPQRWMCLAMVAVILFSLYVGRPF